MPLLNIFVKNYINISGTHLVIIILILYSKNSLKVIIKLTICNEIHYLFL